MQFQKAIFDIFQQIPNQCLFYLWKMKPSYSRIYLFKLKKMRAYLLYCCFIYQNRWERIYWVLIGRTMTTHFPCCHLWKKITTYLLLCHLSEQMRTHLLGCHRYNDGNAFSMLSFFITDNKVYTRFSSVEWWQLIFHAVIFKNDHNAIST